VRFREFAALGAAAVAVFFACARPYPPPGGEADRLPPRVVSITPAPLSVGVARDERVIIRFDERISERGIRDAVVVSPLTSELRVERGRSELRIWLRGGWEPDRIYHVVVQPVVQDLFGNLMTDPLEVVFSTGPEIPQTAVAGLVTDRLTGKPAAGAWIAAVREPDSVAYGTLSDEEGLFALRHLPPGVYRLRAFMDQNRDRQANFREAQDSAAIELADGDTAVLTLTLLVPDTTPANVIRAEAPDSLHVRVHLDDHIDPAAPGVTAGVTVALRLLPDSTPWPIERVMLPHEFDEHQRRLRATADSAYADSLARSGVGQAAQDSAVRDVLTRAATPRPGPTWSGAPSDSAAAPLPTRELVVIPARPLRASARYRIELSGIVNINGVRGGGGAAEFTAPAPPAPDTARAGTPPPDTIPPDSADAGAQRDTIPPDPAFPPRR